MLNSIKTKKFLAGGTATLLMTLFGSPAFAGPIATMADRVNCDSCCCDISDLKPRTPARVFKHGIDDNYQGGNSEKTSPRSAFFQLQNLIDYAAHVNKGPNDLSRDYDELHSNEYFLETVNVPGAANMKGGWLVFQLKSNGTSLDHNDNLYFGDVAGLMKEQQDATAANRTPDRSKYRAYAKRVNQFLTETDSDGPVFKRDSMTGAYYARLDRVKLISGAHGGVTNLLEQIKTDGFMDLVIQDDTGVDYVAILTCLPKRGVIGKPRKLNEPRRQIKR